MPALGGIVASSSGVTVVPAWWPASQGLLAASLDPAVVTTSSGVGNAGTPHSLTIPVPAPITITNLLCYVNGAGATLTANQCYGAIFASDGTLIANTASQHTAWQSTGLKTMALTVAGGQSLTQGGTGVLLVVAFWANGTTQPQLACTQPVGSGALSNVLVSGRTRRGGYYSVGGVTSPPSTMWTPDTNDGLVFWAGLN